MPHFLNAGSLSQPGKQASGRNIAKVGFASAHEGAARPSVATRSGGKSQIAFVSSNKLKLRKERELESPLAGTLEPGVRGSVTRSQSSIIRRATRSCILPPV